MKILGNQTFTFEEFYTMLCGHLNADGSLKPLMLSHCMVLGIPEGYRITEPKMVIQNFFGFKVCEIEERFFGFKVHSIVIHNCMFQSIQVASRQPVKYQTK